MKTPVICLLVLTTALAGCQTADFAAYTGTQRNWPTQSAASVKDYNGVQVIHGLPAKPYDVLGKASVVDPVDENLAATAKAHGADAVMLTDSPLMKDGDAALASERAASASYGSPGFMSSADMPPAAHPVITAWFIKYRNAQ